MALLDLALTHWNIQGHAMWISSPILSWLQPHRAGIFSYQGQLPPSLAHPRMWHNSQQWNWSPHFNTGICVLHYIPRCARVVLQVRLWMMVSVQSKNTHAYCTSLLFTFTFALANPFDLLQCFVFYHSCGSILQLFNYFDHVLHSNRFICKLIDPIISLVVEEICVGCEVMRTAFGCHKLFEKIRNCRILEILLIVTWGPTCLLGDKGIRWNVGVRSRGIRRVERSVRRTWDRPWRIGWHIWGASCRIQGPSCRSSWGISRWSTKGRSSWVLALDSWLPR